MQKFLKNLFSKDNDVIEENDEVLSNPLKDTLLKKNGDIDWQNNPLLRHEMFKLLKARVGKFEFGVTSQEGRPPTMTTAEFKDVVKDITIELGLPSNKDGAVRNQIAWACTSQSPRKQQISVYTQNRAIAAYVGFMSIEDVVRLYQKEGG